MLAVESSLGLQLGTVTCLIAGFLLLLAGIGDVILRSRGLGSSHRDEFDEISYREPGRRRTRRACLASASRVDPTGRGADPAVIGLLLQAVSR